MIDDRRGPGYIDVVHVRTAIASPSLLVLACAGPTDPVGVDPADPAEPPPEPALHPDTVLVEDHACFESVSFTEERDRIEFVFSCDPADVGIDVGSIVVGVTDGGYLRRVESVELPGDGLLVAHTGPAAIAEAVSHASFHEEIAVTEERLSIDLSNTVLWWNHAYPVDSQNSHA